MAFTGPSYQVKRKQKGSESGDSFDGRMIEIPSSRMLHSRVPRVPTDLEPRLRLTWVGVLKESSGLVVTHRHV